MIQIKRVYDPPSGKDGYRILVDRLWPRGISKARAELGCWLKDIAPSNELRRWFGHDPSRWESFQMKYREELKGKQEDLEQIRVLEKEHGTITLLFAAHDQQRNNAVVLRDVLQSKAIEISVV